MAKLVSWTMDEPVKSSVKELGPITFVDYVDQTIFSRQVEIYMDKTNRCIVLDDAEIRILMKFFAGSFKHIVL